MQTVSSYGVELRKQNIPGNLPVCGQLPDRNI